MNIAGKRKLWYIISLLFIIPGIISLFMNGLNKGIDFEGGHILELRFEQTTDEGQVRSVLDQYDLGASSSIQGTEDGSILIRTKDIPEEELTKIKKSFSDKLGKFELVKESKVGPVIGKELTRNALIALGIAAVCMVVYITFRFEFKFGIAAIIALLHDVLITLGIFSILQIEIDVAFVAAILTIIGYSINDTIVIFDRIRENLRRKKQNQTLEEVVNNSIFQTLARSINTVLTVLFVLIALVVFGGGTIKNFILAMVIGVVSGAYSSIFTASPIWLELKRFQKA